MSSSGPPQKIQGWAGIAIRVSFCLHRRMTCMVDKRPSRARSIFLCVGRGVQLPGAPPRRRQPVACAPWCMPLANATPSAGLAEGLAWMAHRLELSIIPRHQEDGVLLW